MITFYTLGTKVLLFSKNAKRLKLLTFSSTQFLDHRLHLFDFFKLNHFFNTILIYSHICNLMGVSGIGLDWKLYYGKLLSFWCQLIWVAEYTVFHLFWINLSYFEPLINCALLTPARLVLRWLWNLIRPTKIVGQLPSSTPTLFGLDSGQTNSFITRWLLWW